MIKTGIRPGYSILVCPDSELLREKIDELTSDWLTEPKKWERHVVWGEDPLDSQFWNNLTQTGLFAVNKLFICRNANLWPVAVWKALSATLASPRDNVWPIICLEVEQEKKKFKIPAHIQKQKCYEFAEKQKWIWMRPQLEGQTLQAYVKERLKALKLNMGPEVLNLFIDSVMPYAKAINLELDKLALAAGNKPVTANMLAIDSGNYLKNAFAIIKNLESGRLADAWMELERGDAAARLFFLLTVMAKELRLLWSLNHGENPWMPRGEEELKRRLAKSLGKKGIALGFELLANAEWSVKSGNNTPRQCLEDLCVKLTRLFAV